MENALAVQADKFSIMEDVFQLVINVSNGIQIMEHVHAVTLDII